MGIGTSIFLIALGAILRYGVQDRIESIDLSVIGLILMLVGVLGLAITLLYAKVWSQRRVDPPAERPVVRDREYL